MTDVGVLALIAHPDDEALLCGGTLALAAARGMPVHVVCHSDGAQGRDSLLQKSCELLGASCEMLGFPATRFQLDGTLVTQVDAVIETRRPTIVLTHSQSGGEHQDHLVLAQAVDIAVRRSSVPLVHLAVEPPTASPSFVPNVFVEVTASWEQKQHAVAAYRPLLTRAYMHDDVLLQRAQWWRHVAGYDTGLYEAFELKLLRVPADALRSIIPRAEG